MNPGNRNYHVDGNPAESEVTGVVSGDTSSPETEATQKEMLRRNEVMKALEDLQEKYSNKEEIARAFEDASPLTNTTERLEAVLDNLNELSRKLEEEGGIFAISQRRRVSSVINKLRELL